MAEVPEDNDYGPDEEEDLGLETRQLLGPLKIAEDAEPDTMTHAGLELPVEVDQEPQSEIKEEDSKETESTKNVPSNLKPTGRSQEEIAEETEIDLSSKAEPGIPQEVKLETPREKGGELFKDLEVTMDEELEEPDLEPPEDTKPDVAEDVPVESAKERDLELPKETEPEVRRATVIVTRLELLEETKPEVPEESLGEQYGETSLEPPELTKPEFPNETPRKSIEEVDLEPPKMTTPEFPGETQIKSPEEKRREPSEQTTPEFPKEKASKSTEEAGLETAEETEPEVPEETGRKLTEEKGIESPEQTIPDFPHQKPSKSAEKTRRKSTEKKSLELPQQATPKFPKKELKTQCKSTKEMGQVPPQKTKTEVQEKTQTEATKGKDVELLDKAQPLLIRETHKEFAKEDRPEPITFECFEDKDKLECSDCQLKLLVKETEKVPKDSMLGPLTVEEINSVNTAYEFSEEPPKLNEVTNTSNDLYPSKSQKDLRQSFTKEKVVDLSLELEKLIDKEKTQPGERIELQLECLKWSPEEVAEWISELGFPQYKECFTTNFISGRKLIHVNCSNLPQMGITDFEDMKVICRHTRELLGIEEPLFKRTISLPYRDNMGLFLEQKGHTGVKSDSLTLSEFVKGAGLQDYDSQITAREKNEKLLH